MGLRVEGPRALSTTLFRAIRNLETKGAVGLQRTARGQITRVRLTATGRSATRQKENFQAKLRVLSNCHPAAKHMIFDLGVQAAQLSKWIRSHNVPPAFTQVINRIGKLIEKHEAAH